jgi:hypothetical protein
MSRRRKKRLVVVPTFPPFKPHAPRRPTRREDVTARLFAATVESAAQFYAEKPRTFSITRREGMAIFDHESFSAGWRPRYWYDGNCFTLAWLNFRVRFQKEPRHFWILWSRADDFDEFLP